MEKKQFQAESKRLLDLMIHSIYSHKDIFLRELISNASDATDKLYYHAMQQGQTGILRDNLPITITLDKDARTLTISDHGCGMTADEMEENLGTIAHSGSLKFKQENEKQDDIDIIGQFGVGFYAAFIVAPLRLRSSHVHRGWKAQTAGFLTVQRVTPLRLRTKMRWVLILF